MGDDYTDLLIRIRQKEEATGLYSVEAQLEDGSVFLEGSLALDLAGLRALEGDSRAYGLRLFEALFSGSIRNAYDRAMGIADAQTEGRLRVRLWIGGKASELNALAWERLHAPANGQSVALASSANTPFSRYKGLKTAEPPPVGQRPLRILFALSNPTGLPAGMQAMAVDEEALALAASVEEMQRRKEVQATFLPGRTGLSEQTTGQLLEKGFQIQAGPTSLENLVRLLPKHHVFHFLGHGRFRESADEPGEGALFLEDEDGSWRPVTGAVLASKFEGLGRMRPHLTFLAACESAKGDGRHAFVGVGPKLVEAGAPAVVAMGEKVRVDLVRTLTGHFYRCLLEHGWVDLALNQARQLLDQEGADWSAPILFSRLKENRLLIPTSEAQALSRRTARNVGLMLATVALLALYFYVHIYSYLVPSLVVGGTLVSVLAALRFLQSFISWSVADLFKERLGRWLAAPAFTWASWGLLGAAALLFAVTSSVYVSFDQAAVDLDELEVELRRANGTVLDRTRLNASRPILGKPFFFPLTASGDLELAVLNPPIFETLSLGKVRPPLWKTRRLPNDLQRKPLHILRIVPSPTSLRLPQITDDAAVRYALILKVDGQREERISDLRRYQNFYVGGSESEIAWVRNREEEDEAVRDYILQLQLIFGQQEIQNLKEQLRSLGRAVAMPLRHGATVTAQVQNVTDGTIVAEDTVRLDKETDDDHDWEIKTIILKRKPTAPTS